MMIVTAGIDIARQRIAEEAAARAGHLDLSGLDLSSLPDALAELRDLQSLDCSWTQVSDLTPLQRSDPAPAI
jgi:Leucine-rich repeat (LRR) protein